MASPFAQAFLFGRSCNASSMARSHDLLLVRHQGEMVRDECIPSRTLIALLIIWLFGLIKSYNKSLTPLDNESWRVSGYRAIYYVINDTLCEFLSFVMAALVTLFLNHMNNQSIISLVTINGTPRAQETFVNNKYYMISTGLVPPILNFYFTRSRVNVTRSCLDHSSVVISGGVWTRSTMEDETMAAAVRGFPVVIIYHAVATVCCWFMEMQRGQQSTNMQMLEKFKRDLAQAQKGQDIKKKS
jgi:hypothetical protein